MLHSRLSVQKETETSMKLGLTIDNSYNEIIQKIAKKNNLKPTTICSLIIENQLNFFEQNDVLPTFKQVTIMKYDQPKPKIAEKDLEEKIRLARDNSFWEQDD